jgi:hypothetical protein
MTTVLSARFTTCGGRALNADAHAPQLLERLVGGLHG